MAPAECIASRLYGTSIHPYRGCVDARTPIRSIGLLQLRLMLIVGICILNGCGTTTNDLSTKSNQPFDQVPTVTSITPGTVTAGSTQLITLTGSGFSAVSTVDINTDLGQPPIAADNVHVVSPSSITFTAVIPPQYIGSAPVQVRNGGPSLSSSPANLIIYPPSPQPPPSLPAYNVFAYHASGSPLEYHCSGTAGSYKLTCDDSVLDFTPDEGIRIVSAGPPEANPAIAEQPQIAKQGQVTGNHDYCYIVFVADALSGISEPSPETCISNEPEMYLFTTYNRLQGEYQYPLATLLWYVSEDDGPFQLFSVSTSVDNNGEAEDLGQRPNSRGGWPTSFAVGSQELLSKNQDLFSEVAAVRGNQITLKDPLVSSVLHVEVDHDDTGAIQKAINAANAVGGGIVELGDGTFNVRRPTFGCKEINASCPTGYTTDFNLRATWYGYENLYLDHRSTGNIFLEGNGPSTIIQTSPDGAGSATFFSMGNGVPVDPPYTTIKIEEADKGATTVTLASNSGLNTLHPGDDIWLYTGSFGEGVCQDSGNTPGGNCHYSEINTIKSISGGVLSLVYPTSKRFYDDGLDSFGLVKMPISPHNVGISDFTINTYGPVTGLGMVYGLTVNHVTVNGFVSHGAFLGGMKRDVLIENSSWGLGAGDASWKGTTELDQCTDVRYVNDTITGYFAPGAEGPSAGARIYLSEGTSQVVFEHNKIDHVAILSDATTDDIIDNNVFNDSPVAIGTNYNEFSHDFEWGPTRISSFISFGSQATAQITNNVFNVDSAFGPPWIIRFGHFTHGRVAGNVITTDTPTRLPAIASDGGDIEANVINIGTHSTLTSGIVAMPDEGPGVPSSYFTIRGNQINASTAPAGIYIMNSGFTDTAPVCITGNSISLLNGKPIVVSESTSNLSCDGTDRSQ